MTEQEVRDDTEGGRFVVVEDGLEAELVYRRDGRRLELVHTGVPAELGGRGLGGRLVGSAIGQARSEGLTLVPLCPFAREWLERHPDAAATVSIDWPPNPDHAGSGDSTNPPQEGP